MTTENILSWFSHLPEEAYKAASLFSRKMRDWMASSGSADADLLGSLHILRTRCRDAYRNYNLARAIINRIVEYSVGPGLKLKVAVDQKELGFDSEFAVDFCQNLQKRFEEWADNCDYDRMQDFGGLQELSLKSALMCGDSFVNTIAKKELMIQVIEADQIVNPSFCDDFLNYRGGVELDKETFQPIAYHVLARHPGERFPIWQWNRFPIFGDKTKERRIFHLMLKSRPGEHRGVPLLSCVLNELRTLEKYTDAELQAAVVAACFCVGVESESNSGMGYTTNTTTQEKETPIKPAMIVNLRPGEKLQPIDPKRPNASFQPFVRSVYEQTGAGVSLPMEFLLLVFGSSYSASRAAISQAWITIMYYRNLVAKRVCTPIFKLWLRWIGIPEDVIPHIHPSWIGIGEPVLDGYKEMLAIETAIKNGITTREKECQKRGDDYWDMHNKLVIEERRRREEGLSSIGGTPVIPEFLKDNEDGSRQRATEKQTSEA